MASVVRVQPGQPAFDRLAAVVAGAQAGDPLAPVTVAVPSARAGLALRRRLAAAGRGIANVGFRSLDDVADILGGPALAAEGRLPLTGPLRAEALRVELRARAGVFAGVASHPATERSLDRAFRELRTCSTTTLDRLADGGGRAADLVRLFRAWRSRLAPRWYDEDDVAEAAAASIVAAPTGAIATIGHLVVFLPKRLRPAQRRMIDALGPAATVLEVDIPAGPPAAATTVISAPDADDEVRAAVRGIAARLDAGVPLHRMALLVATGEPYARLAAQHLDAARIPWNGPAIRTLSDTVAGGALLALLGLADHGWRRGDVIGWLTAAPVVDDRGNAVPAASWDTQSRRAGVLAGADQWDERLAARAAQLRDELAGASPDEREEPHFARVQTYLDHTLSLRTFVAALVAATDPGDRHRWSDLTDWALRLLEQYLGGAGAHHDWPVVEQEAWESVQHAVQGLAGLDLFGLSTDAGTFRRAVERELDAPAQSAGRFGDGVFVAPVSAAPGLDADVVFVVGLAEGLLPGRAADDALIPERDREAAGGELADRSGPLDDDRAAFVHALAVGVVERVLLSPRADLRRARGLLPSRWLLEIASGLAGETVRADDLAVGRVPAAAGDAVRSVPSFEAGVARPETPASLLDFDLGALLQWRSRGGRPADHPVVTDDPPLATGLAALDARRRTDFTSFDGKVARGAVPVPGADEPTGPTSLEVYAQCPRRYLLSRVLRVAAVEKPEEITRLSPRDRGSLVHLILERYVLSLLGGQARSLDRLLAIADEAEGEWEAKGLTGKRLLWHFDQQVLRRELTRFHAIDEVADLEPLAAELAFGDDDQAPVTVDVGGRALSFRGYADRVDRRPDGSLVVTDYKTGSAWRYKSLNLDPVDRGTKLQLPLYGLAARERFAPDAGVRSRYWFISEQGRFEEVGYDVDASVLERFREVLGVIVDGITAGVFPARPGEAERGSWVNCMWCDYQQVCPSDRGRQWERKRGARELAAYVELAEAEPTADENDEQSDELVQLELS